LVICIWSFCYHKKSSDNDFGAFLCLIDDLLLGISRLSVPICLFSVSLLDCMLFFLIFLTSDFYSAVTGKEAASIVLPPFSVELTVDTELKLSQDDFK